MERHRDPCQGVGVQSCPILVQTVVGRTYAQNICLYVILAGDRVCLERIGTYSPNMCLHCFIGGVPGTYRNACGRICFALFWRRGCQEKYQNVIELQCLRLSECNESVFCWTRCMERMETYRKHLNFSKSIGRMYRNGMRNVTERHGYVWLKSVQQVFGAWPYIGILFPPSLSLC